MTHCMHENDALDRLRCNQFTDLQWNLKLDFNYLAQLPVRVASNDNLYYMYY